MHTEVLRVVEEAVVKVRIMNPVSLNLFGNRRRILAQMDGNLLKGKPLILGILDVESVFECKVFLVSWY